MSHCITPDTRVIASLPTHESLCHSLHTSHCITPDTQVIASLLTHESLCRSLHTSHCVTPDNTAERCQVINYRQIKMHRQRHLTYPDVNHDSRDMGPDNLLLEYVLYMLEYVQYHAEEICPLSYWNKSAIYYVKNSTQNCTHISKETRYVSTFVTTVQVTKQDIYINIHVCVYMYVHTRWFTAQAIPDMYRLHVHTRWCN